MTASYTKAFIWHGIGWARCRIPGHRFYALYFGRIGGIALATFPLVGGHRVTGRWQLGTFPPAARS